MASEAWTGGLNRITSIPKCIYIYFEWKKSYVPLQVIFCGKGSNQMLTHIINQSSLIDTYRQVHINIEKNFVVLYNSMQHALMNMANML